MGLVQPSTGGAALHLPSPLGGAAPALAGGVSVSQLQQQQLAAGQQLQQAWKQYLQAQAAAAAQQQQR
jgi:hypothetical protein